MATCPDLFSPLPLFEAFLAQRLASSRTDRPPALTEALTYAALSGGKRIRPLLCWHACVACLGHGESSLVAGAAIEMVHAFSLVHDDLPALDNDDLRRGRPTLHRHAGEAMAILAGDQLLVEAFDTLLHAPGPTPALRLALARELSDATSRMVGGQVYDTLGNLPANLDPHAQLRLIHENKTGALIRAACRMGALSALPNPDAAESDPRFSAIDAYASSLGLAFQIVDDLIDVTQTSEHAGKRTGKDQAGGKLTYPIVLGLDRSRTEVDRLRSHALDSLRTLGQPADDLRALASLICERTH